MNNEEDRLLGKAFHIPTRTAMIVAVIGDNAIHLRNRGYRVEIDGRHYACPGRLDLRFASKQEIKRFNHLAACPSDWEMEATFIGDAAVDEIRRIIADAVNPAVKEALRGLIR